MKFEKNPNFFRDDIPALARHGAGQKNTGETVWPPPPRQIFNQYATPQ